MKFKVKLIVVLLVLTTFIISAPSQLTAITSGSKVRHSHRENVEKKIELIENAVQEISESYDKRSVWQAPSDPPANESSSHKVARYVLAAPTYIIRFVTWPFAAAGNALIKKGVVRKVVDIISNDERTFWVYPKIEFGFGSGFGGGVGLKDFDLFNRGYELSAYYQIHINMNQEAKIALKKPEAFFIAGKPVYYELSTNLVHHPKTDFFGIGPTSSLDNKTNYFLKEVNWGGWFGYEVLPNLMIKGHNYYTWDEGTNSAPSPPEPGSGQTIYYTDIGASLIHDDRDSTVSPTRGGTRRIKFSRFQGLNTTAHDYNEYKLDVVQYVNILKPDHVLVFRNAWTFQQPTGGTIPFYRLTKLDVNSPLRGFPYGRFTDKASVIFNAEYRFPVWKYVGGQLFFDTGRVFKNPKDFAFKHFKYTGGGGVQLHTKEFFLLNFQLGYGGEGVKVLLETSQLF